MVSSDIVLVALGNDFKVLVSNLKGGAAAAPKQALRDRLGVDGASEVLPRNTRDNVEHFDERMDNWIGGSNQEILEIVLPDRAAYDYPRVDQTRVTRVLILGQMAFISEKRDESKFQLDLAPLHAEVERIGVAAEDWIKTKSPYQFIHPRG